MNRTRRSATAAITTVAFAFAALVGCTHSGGNSDTVSKKQVQTAIKNLGPAAVKVCETVFPLGLLHQYDDHNAPEVTPPSGSTSSGYARNGSGLECDYHDASGNGDGYYTILVTNPGTPDQGQGLVASKKGDLWVTIDSSDQSSMDFLRAAAAHLG